MSTVIKTHKYYRDRNATPQQVCCSRLESSGYPLESHATIMKSLGLTQQMTRNILQYLAV
jgi:hypothetical protein